MTIANRPQNKGLGLFRFAAAAAAAGLIATSAMAQGQREGNGQREGDGGRMRQPGGGRGGFMMGGGMGGRFGGMMDPQMTSRDLTRYSEILQLGGDQQEAAKALLDAYQLEVQNQRDQMQRQMEEMRDRARGDGGGGGDWTAIRESMQKFRAEKSRLDKEFMGDLKSLLTPEQEGRWQTFERVHRREKSVARGFISGERMDVIKLVDDVKVPEQTRAELAPILAQYEEELDRELVNREKVQEGLMGRMGEMGPGGDMAAMQRMIEEGREASIRVRDVNRKYARQVQGSLPEGKQFEFARAVKSASFPDIYRETYADRAIGSAMGFADLEPAQKESLETIRANYTREVAVLNDKLASAQEEMEENFNLERMREGGGRNLGPVGELRRQKRELEQNTVENLRKLLTPQQAERLPEREQGRDGRGGGGRDDDQGDGGRRRGNEQRRGNDRV